MGESAKKIDMGSAVELKFKRLEGLFGEEPDIVLMEAVRDRARLAYINARVRMLEPDEQESGYEHFVSKPLETAKKEKLLAETAISRRMYDQFYPAVDQLEVSYPLIDEEYKEAFEDDDIYKACVRYYLHSIKQLQHLKDPGADTLSDEDLATYGLLADINQYFFALNQAEET